MGYPGDPSNHGGDPGNRSSEVITATIADIETAHRLIVQGACSQLRELDWEPFGVTAETVDDAFAAFYPLALRQSPLRLPINLAVEEHSDADRELIAATPEDHKRVIEAGWLLMEDEISPEYATATRDLLYLKLAEIIAGRAAVDPQRAVMHFASDPSGSYLRASLRLNEFIVEHSWLLR